MSKLGEYHCAQHFGCRKEGVTMSKKTLDNIRELCESIDRNRDLVAERMRHAGFDPDPVVADSLAKYWQALEKLSAE